MVKPAKPSVLDSMLVYAEQNPSSRKATCTICTLRPDFREGVLELKKRGALVPQIVAALKSVGGPELTPAQVRYHFQAGHHNKASK